MALATDLMGLGLPPEQAAFIGFSDLTTLAGATTAIGTATAIHKDVTNVNATTAASQTAFRLPEDAPLDRPYLVTNSSATTALVFPHVTGSINAVAVNSSVSIAQNLGRIFIRKSATRWVSFLTA